MPYYQRLFELLSDEDPITTNFVSDNFDTLRNRFGNDMPDREVSKLMARLLDKKSVAPYVKSVNAFLPFTARIDDKVWAKLIDRVISELADESTDVTHRWQLLHLTSGVHSPVHRAAELSEVLYNYKETGQVDELKKKSWEVYEPLSRNGMIPKFSPPPPTPVSDSDKSGERNDSHATES